MQDKIKRPPGEGLAGVGSDLKGGRAAADSSRSDRGGLVCDLADLVAANAEIREFTIRKLR